jgi:hypothetical protein
VPEPRLRVGVVGLGFGFVDDDGDDAPEVVAGVDCWDDGEAAGVPNELELVDVHAARARAAQQTAASQLIRPRRRDSGDGTRSP